ncbi:hypothetical protein OPQ81_002594 [Rhizoctonia solani]|nr:hypothetical protein OPQ81_002594 [Rhizoctonia solani]
MNAKLEDGNIFAEGAASLALAANALAEAAQALSEAAAALSTMSHDANSPPTINQPLGSTMCIPEKHETDDEDNQTPEPDDECSSVGANARNNAHPQDTTPEFAPEEDLHIKDPAPAPSHPQIQPELSSSQKQPCINPLEGLIYPGLFYLVLEEEFDALPLILAYANSAKRTICYVPTSGSLFPWESILSPIIPNRQVRSAISFSGNNIMQLRDVVAELASSDNPSLLILRSTFIHQAYESKAHSICDGVIFWGLPGAKFWPDLMQAAQQSQHTIFDPQSTRI